MARSSNLLHHNLQRTTQFDSKRLHFTVQCPDCPKQEEKSRLHERQLVFTIKVLINYDQIVNHTVELNTLKLDIYMKFS